MADLMALTYVDSVAVVRTWINSRTGTLVGEGNPIQKGAHFKHLDGAAAAVYVLLEEITALPIGGAENPDMAAQISAQVFGGTREAATAGAVALAEEITVELSGRPVIVTGVGRINVADGVQGPTWAPEDDVPRLVVQFTAFVRPL